MGKHSEVVVGLDVAKAKNAVAMAEGGRNGEVRYLGEIENTAAATRRLIAKLSKTHIIGPAGARRRQGVRVGTINHELQVIRRILNLAARERVDESGQTWLATAPKIKFFPNTDKRKPYPLRFTEQDRPLAKLPPHLADITLFAFNTGCRDAEVCGLRRDCEAAVPELDTVVFIVPDHSVKNGDARLVVLNRVARGDRAAAG